MKNPLTLRGGFGLIFAPIVLTFLVSCTAQRPSAMATSQAVAANAPPPPMQSSPGARPSVAVVAPMPPPPSLPETIPPPPPGPDGYFAWNSGHYHWGGQGSGFVWMPGNFTERPWQGSVWTNGGWTNQNGTWGYTPGNWQ